MIEENNVFQTLPSPHATKLISVLHSSCKFCGACKDGREREKWSKRKERKETERGSGTEERTRQRETEKERKLEQNTKSFCVYLDILRLHVQGQTGDTLVLTHLADVISHKTCIDAFPVIIGQQMCAWVWVVTPKGIHSKTLCKQWTAGLGGDLTNQFQKGLCWV